MSIQTTKAPTDEQFEKQVRERQKLIYGQRYVGASLSLIEGISETTGRALNKFMKEPKNFLVYLGAPGVGKTYFCAALTEWAMKNFATFRYFNEGQFFEKIRSSMDNYQGDYVNTMRFMIDDDLLIFDDLGSTGINEWRKEIIFLMIDERYNSEKPTIIISNLNKEKFKTMYEERFNDRLFATQNTIIEAYDLQSKRKQGL